MVEAGANIGVHTVALSKLTGPQGAVVAFEPQRLVFQTLCANLALNSCANVHALQAGLGAMAGQMRVPPFPPDRPLNFGGVSLMGGETGEAVAIKTLDDMDLPACALIKLDIEGMEVDALYGAARTIKTLRPLLYVENDRAARSDQLISLLLDWDYRLFAHVTPLFSVANHAGCQDDIFGAVASFNMFCVPRERNLTVTDGVEITTPRMWIWPQV